MERVICLLIGYVCGLFQTSYFIGKFYKKDIRNYGSGNFGSTNAFRVLGKKGGAAVFFLDILKGGLALLIATYGGATISPLFIAVFSLIGHVYPIFANFRGGKAVATTAGIILFYSPTLFLTLFIIFAITLKIWKMVSLSSTIIAIATVMIVWFGNYDLTAKIMFSLIAALIIYKHIPNYKRILNGTENKVTFL